MVLPLASYSSRESIVGASIDRIGSGGGSDELQMVG